MKIECVVHLQFATSYYARQVFDEMTHFHLSFLFQGKKREMVILH